MRKSYSLSFVICLLLFAALAAGCARTVTSYVTYGSELVVDVTLRGTMEPSANRYFLVLSRTPAFTVPQPKPDNLVYELIEPGMTPRAGCGAAADYYTKYYSSWESYCFVDPAGYSLVNGPFVPGTSITHEVIASLGTVTNHLKFNFALSRAFGATIPGTIYFDVVTVPWPTDVTVPRLTKDHLGLTDAYLSTVVGSTKTILNATDLSLDPALDITQCTVTIQ
jgi:hypothetical protein